MNNGKEQPLIEFGLAVLKRPGTGSSASDAARELVAEAVKNGRHLPARSAMLLATVDWCNEADNLPAAVRRELEAELGYEVPLIGGSMAKLYSSTDPAGIIHQGIVLILWRSEHMHTTTAFLEDPYCGIEPDREKLEKLARELEAKAKVRLGSSAERYLFGIFPGFLSDGAGGRMLLDSELHQAVLAAFRQQYYVYGASAADALRPTTGYQFADGKILRSGLALALVESDLLTGTRMRSGFRPWKDRRVSVDRLARGLDRGYEVELLDGKPAAITLAELKQSGAPIALGNPVFGLASRIDYNVVLPIDPVESGGSLRLNRKVSLGDPMFVMEPPPHDRLLDVYARMIADSVDSVSGESDLLRLVLVFVCTGLFRHYEELLPDWGRIREWLDQSRSGVPVVVGLCAGEFALDQLRRARANNMSLWVRCYLGQLSSRAVNRDLQRKLMNASAALLTCGSPARVMEVAVKQAVEAGAWGGQICILDENLGRIVGKDLGYAYARPGSGHNWTVIAGLTDRAAPKERGAGVPRYLEEWAMPVVGAVPQPPAQTSHQEEDILTLIARTLQAVFVPDQRDPRFHCDPEAVKVAGFTAMLAIPLVGSDFRVIGTLQISFADGTLLDRESFALWVSYGQKVTAILEREQEVEERTITTAITEKSSELLRMPVDLEYDPHFWCREFAEVIRRQMRTDYAHIRVLKPGKEGDEYYLVASVGDGPLANLRTLTRPVTRGEKDGGCARTRLEKGGRVINTRKETQAFHEDVKALENADKYSEDLQQELRKIGSTANLPLLHEGKLVGYLVIDSYREYFFTQRWERVARVAAEQTATVLRLREAERQRAIVQYYRRSFEERMTELPGRSEEAPDMTSSEMLRALLGNLCEFVRADWAALWVWHEAPKKLVLHTEFNWFGRMEGKAWYELGEGWTGRLAENGADISVVTATSQDSRHASEKYHPIIEPPEQRRARATIAPRIGIRLSAGTDLVGVVTLGYYLAHSDRLPSLSEDVTHELLQDAAEVIALWATSLRGKEQREQHERLQETKDEVARRLIEASKGGGEWQDALDRLAEGFRVKSAVLYRIRDDMIENGWISSASLGPIGPSPLSDRPEVKSKVWKLMLQQNEADSVSSGGGYRQGEIVDDRFSILVWSPEGQVCGLLELVGREETAEHPFNILDADELHQAQDVALFLGAGIASRDYQRERRELLSRLETATRIGAAGLFGAGLLHQLKGPFAKIQRAVDMLRNFPADAPEQYFKLIEDQRQRALSIIDSAAAGHALRVEAESIQTVVREALRVVQDAVPPAGVHLAVSNDLRVLVRVDLMTMVTALVNLLDNALDAVNGKGTITVTTELSADARFAIVRIHNTGPALGEDEIARFFLPGYSTKGDEHHLGMGLPLVRQTVEGAGGELKMYSPPDWGGVESVVSLPIHIVAATGEGSTKKGA